MARVCRSYEHAEDTKGYTATRFSILWLFTLGLTSPNHLRMASKEGLSTSRYPPQHDTVWFFFSLEILLLFNSYTYMLLFLIQKFNQETKIMVNLILLKLVPFSIDQTIDWYVFADWHFFTFHTLNPTALSVILSVSVMLGRVLQKAVSSDRNDSELIFAHRFLRWLASDTLIWMLFGHTTACAFPQTHQAPSNPTKNFLKLFFLLCAQ